jgi:hypothetical protein
MPATAISGASFTFTINSTAYSGQVTGGTITRETAITRIKTLTDSAVKNTDDNWMMDAAFLYDEETGLYGALNTAQGTGAAVTVAIVGGDAKWTGSMNVSSAAVTYAADGVATVAASFMGTLTLADAP